MTPSSPRILFTGFKPFAGRPVNGSETVVKFLHSSASPFTVRTLILDVVWGEAERRGIAAIKSFGPDMVYCLGEGEAGVVKLETVGVNLRGGTDNAGASAGGEIEKGGPARRLSRFCCAMTYCQDYAFPVSISTDAGLYLCNNALYSFLGTDVRRVLFAHLPPQGTVPDKDYTGAIIPIVKDILRSNFPWI
jgi:pyrrolidone-carboxylate peptidase